MDEIWGLLVVIGIIVFIVLAIREWLVKTKRFFHNAKRSIVEVRDYDDIEREENVIRSVRSMSKEFMKQEMKEGGFQDGGAYFCSNCGAALKENARFCSQCGRGSR